MWSIIIEIETIKVRENDTTDKAKQSNLIKLRSSSSRSEKIKIYQRISTIK